MQPKKVASFPAAPAAVLSADEARAAARAVRLRYVTDAMRGISRHRSGKGFSYCDAAGELVRDLEILNRIKALAVPPAWTAVWIAPFPNAHIQATGRDARNRKQYRYHARWRAQRDETKYEHMLRFGDVLPRIRRRVAADLAQAGLPRTKVLAAVVRLLELTLARVGNPEYARENNSFGLTTLQDRHVRIKGGSVELDFRAKHGIRFHGIVNDRKLATILKRCRDLPGAELFQYLDEDGTRHSIDSAELNAYLRDISDHDITAKDFRTWAGTSLAVLAIAALSQAAPTKRTAAEIVRQVAAHLNNTPAVCRKCYIHPRVLERYLTGHLVPLLGTLQPGSYEPGSGLLEVEKFVIRFLGDADQIGFAALRPGGT